MISVQLFLIINIVDHTLMWCMDLSYLNLLSHIYIQFYLLVGCNTSILFRNYSMLYKYGKFICIISLLFSNY